MSQPSVSTSGPARFWDASHNRAVRNVATLRDEVLAGFQLSASEWFVLDIAHAGRKVGISVGEVARTMDVQTTYVALVLRHLQARQLVTTVPAQHDRRVHLVMLTAAGEKLLARSDAALSRAFAGVTTSLDGTDVASYTRVAETLATLPRN